MLDSDTRSWLAKMVVTRKGTDDIYPMFWKVKRIADKVPSKLISDGVDNFTEAYRDIYAPPSLIPAP